MRISDWSSDVCSSDLSRYWRDRLGRRRGGDRRVPTGQPAPSRRPLAALVAGRGRWAAPRLRDRPRRPARRLHPPRGGDGQARWIDEARSVADALLDLFWDADRGGVFTTEIGRAPV